MATMLISMVMTRVYVWQPCCLLRSGRHVHQPWQDLADMLA
jgi:hypothetical protein